MLKTEQILNAKFTPVSKGTYSAEEVDAFLKVVAESYETLNGEKAELLKKISILADKIESYRNDEEAIKLALLDAHRMAETITKNAQIKSDTLIGDAETRSQLILDGANRQASKLVEEAREQAKELVENARNAVNSLTERAQTETDATIAAAKEKAAQIVADATAEGESIVGESKKLFDYYTAENAKLQASAEEFKSAMAALCTEQLSLLSAAPEMENAVSTSVSETEAANEAPVAEEVPEAEIEAAVEEDVSVADDFAAEPEADLPFGQSLMDEIEEEIAAIEEGVAPVAESAEEAEEPSDESDVADEIPEDEPVVYVPEEPEAAEQEIPEQADDEDEEDDLFSLIDDMDLGDITLPESIPASIDDLVPVVNITAEAESDASETTESDDFVLEDDDSDDEDDEFDGFDIDLDTIGAGESDEGEDDEYLTSLFDSMFDD